MPLRYSTSASAASWLTESGTPFDQLVNFGPAVFEAYARLRYIPDPTRLKQNESDVELGDDHLSDIEQTRIALTHLARFIAPESKCYFCVWDGYSNVTLPLPSSRRTIVDLKHRQYVLMEGPLRALDTWELDYGGGNPIPPPAFIWPPDHRWCFASDVDPHWAGVGADARVIDTLLSDESLDVVPATPSLSQPTYY